MSKITEKNVIPLFLKENMETEHNFKYGKIVKCFLDNDHTEGEMKPTM